ncbi:MAG: AraC family transcriptional regulator [Nevskia sp.]|nr:AraC family transcriptional regulator [Nevskia sp.]
MRDSGQLFLMAHQAMVSAGLDVNAIYRRIGYDANKHDMREHRTLHELQLQFWEAIEAVSGDPDIGLRLCPHLPVYRGEILEYLMLSCPRFGEGLHRVVKYLRLVSDAIQARLQVDATTLRISGVVTRLNAPQLRHTEICTLYGMIQFVREMTDGQARLLHVGLRCKRISPQADYERVFGCPVRFEQAESEICVDRALLDFRPSRCNAELFRVHEELAASRLSSLWRQDLIDRIRGVFSRRVEFMDCQLEDVARELEVSPRLLRYKLAQAGTTFSDLLADFRMILARRLLTRTDERLDHIAYVTGFSEPSSFYRAFKRWTGVTPIQYREGHRQPGLDDPSTPSKLKDSAELLLRDPLQARPAPRSSVR